MKNHKKALTDYLIRQGYDEENAQNLVKEAIIKVIEKYVPGSPGWCGDVLFVLYDGGVSMYEVLIYEDNKLTRVKSEHEF